MKTIRFRFYDAVAAEKDGVKPTLVDKIIMSRSDLVHEEIQFDTNREEVSFSSTKADGADGCRFKFIQYSNPHRWRTLEIKVTDTEEQMAWAKCCKDTDLSMNWQEGLPRRANFYKSYIKDEEIYQGPNHIRYDLIGLMSFALEKSPSFWRNVQRWALWAWTVVIRPDPKKVWCSEECTKVFNYILLTCGQIIPTEIDPQESYEKKNVLCGVMEGK
jgi:hypothetical protein